MEYRPWQLRFIQWLDTQPSGTFVNLCGGPWGKTTLANMNQDPKVSYYHSLHQLSQLEEDLQNGKKVAFCNNKDVILLLVEAYKRSNSFKDM
jgi:hypothetical protein